MQTIINTVDDRLLREPALRAGSRYEITPFSARVLTRVVTAIVGFRLESPKKIN